MTDTSDSSKNDGNNQHQIPCESDGSNVSENNDDTRTDKTHRSVTDSKLAEPNDANTSKINSQADTRDDSTPSHEQERVEDDNATSKHNNAKKEVKKGGSSASKHHESGVSAITYSKDEPDLLEFLWKETAKEKLFNRLLGCAYGQALGDAYGLSTEFETRQNVDYNYPDRSKLIPFPDYVLTGHSRRWTRGDWTDDTDQWILILETLTETHNDEPNEVVFAKKLKNWIRNGYPMLGDHGGMGLGANVSQVVHSEGYLLDPLRASEAVWERGNRQAAPNGAVMRCSASAFVHYKDREKVISTTMLLCKTTHFDPRCIASCLAVCLAITDLLNENFDQNDIESLINRVLQETIGILGDSFSQEHRELFLWHTDKERTLEDLNLDEPRSIGYTYKCLGSGFYGLRSTRSFEDTLHDLIRYGGDADTNGAVCGTMYGARYGYKALPYPWLRATPFKKWFDNKLIQCLEQMQLI
ncbi:unnamed protein product [Rotaria magnacalcarata]|uniref:ADP-ribosylglycohydrolase n=1 Tax=Rotaria magnacalcarata TaxID=392030 RepID=A0A819AWN8_9BILA|nr:unnamed protein product [Rotaria magnacalcarata]CAF3791719.1 unnamed protein product [Rotaria magnacalcarata]